MQPNNFKLEPTTVWSFPDRGSHATHSGEYRGNWSPYVPRNLILRYSNPGDRILDQFMGSGTTLIEAKLLHRNAVGVDINPQSVLISETNLQFQFINKHCFNGLYRVNGRGLFNVPYNNSRRESADEKIIMDVSDYLKGITIMDGDFEVACAEAKKGDFVFWIAHMHR